MSQLITLEQALLQLPNAPLTDQPLISNLIPVCSAVIENWCRRIFEQGTYDELQYGTGTPYLYINNPPITAINSIRTGELPAIYVQYKDPLNDTQLATVSVSAESISLTNTFNNVTTSSVFTFSSYPTFNVMSAAINAVPNWQSTLSPQFQYWQCSDLCLYGAYGARNITVPLLIYWNMIPYYRFDFNKGEIFNPGGWLPGYNNYRINYVGGYSSIPVEIQQACAELVALTYQTIYQTPNLASESTNAGYSYTKVVEQNLKLLSATSYQALTVYKLHRIARYQ